MDFEFATRHDVEGRLWGVHSKINNRFRSDLARVGDSESCVGDMGPRRADMDEVFQFQGEDGRRKIVEKRKSVKYYLQFIKSSQRFYRAYIQKLSSRFGGIPEIEEVAQKFKADGRSTSHA